ncbi:hypothetical protein FACS189459_7360 [Bacilli bacterium]|nr:hypothetical protein FACS189459_7360 [Bacilli bacterium]
MLFVFKYYRKNVQIQCSSADLINKNIEYIFYRVINYSNIFYTGSCITTQKGTIKLNHIMLVDIKESCRKSLITIHYKDDSDATITEDFPLEMISLKLMKYILTIANSKKTIVNINNFIHQREDRLKSKERLLDVHEMYQANILDKKEYKKAKDKIIQE